MSERKGNTEEQNEFAENVKGEIIYILDAESGRKGYFCIGCKTQMQAVRTKIKDRKSYFRHDATDVQKNQRQCTFSNENYRHSQAISILNRIRRIKVPTLYKYAPKNSNGKTIKIRDSEFIEAKYTKSELTFYENDYGEVKYGRNPEIDNRNLLIRPDVTFFNLQNEPILLIEIVVTHKIDSEKLAKIKRLGIDTVQVTIPKDSLENIENISPLDKKLNGFITMSKNALTIYTPPITTQRELHKLMNSKESFSKNLSSAENLKLKILYEQLQKVWNLNNTKELKENLDKNYNELRLIQNELKKNSKNIEMEFEDELKENLNQEEREIKLREKILTEKKKNLTYSLETMKEQSKSEVLLWKNDILNEEQKLKKGKENLVNQSAKLNSLNLQKKNIEKKEKEFQKQLQELEREKKITSKLENNYLKNIKDYKTSNTSGINNRLLKFNQKKEDFQHYLNKKKENLNLNLKEFEKAEFAEIKKSDNKGESEFSQRLKRILIARSVFNDWNERENTLKRNRTALECFRKGTYKNWN